MAVRPVFMANDKAPYFVTEDIEFKWNGGFSLSQKRANIKSIHEEFLKKHPEKKILEISSKSAQEGGEQLSAFFLKKYVPELEKSVPVECVFQSGKVFQNGGPYADLLNVTPKEAKTDTRLKESGALVKFVFNGKEFPLEPKTVFYDYIYINALLENIKQAETALNYDAFTDIEFNPAKSINCQAKAAAVFVSLCRNGLKDKIKDFESFFSLFKSN